MSLLVSFWEQYRNEILATIAVIVSIQLLAGGGAIVKRGHVKRIPGSRGSDEGEPRG